MYNDVDMVWLADPFPYLEGHHDVYFTDDMAPVCFIYLPCSLLLAFGFCYIPMEIKFETKIVVWTCYDMKKDESSTDN